MVTIYDPDYASIAAGGNAGDTIYFDGSASSTGEALITSLSGNVDCQIFIERSNDGGTSWQQTTQLAESDGTATFDGNWHSQGNRILVATGKRRVKIVSVDSVSGFVESIGDEV